MKTATEYMLIMVLAGFAVAKGVIPGWNTVHSDFANYYVAASIVVEGDSTDRIYDNPWFQDKIREHGIDTQGKFSPFPPLTAWMLIPLTSFSPLSAQRIMVITNIIFIGLCTLCVSEIARISITKSAIVVLGTGIGLANNIAFGQIYLIMTTCILVAIMLIKKNRITSGSIVLSIFTALKYFPVVVVGAYFLNSVNQQNDQPTESYLKRKDTRVVMLTAICGILLLIAQLIFFGGNIMLQFVHQVLLPHLDGILTDQGLYTFHYQSWDNFLRMLFISDATYNPHPAVDWPQGKTIVKMIITLLVIALVIKAVRPYKMAKSQKRLSVYLTTFTLAALVLLPITATYHFVLAILPVVLIIGNDLLSRRLRIVTLSLFFAIGFIPYTIAFNLGMKWGLFFAYPRLWIISALFIIVAFGLIKESKSSAV